MKLLQNEPLRHHTTMGVGGNAKIFAYPETFDEFLMLLKERYFIIGRGSNLIFTDNNFDGTVISLEKCFNALSFEQIDSKRKLVKVGGGVSLKRLLRECVREGLHGLEFLWGVPGSVGGACHTNTGAFGSSFLEYIREIQIVNQDDKGIKSLRREDIIFSDRVGVKSVIVIDALLILERGESEERLSEFRKWRCGHQPIDKKTAGCIFKNPPGDYAGRLIEKVGLKGERIGDAGISEKHANFVVNFGKATFRDILSLIEMMSEKVFEMFGVKLELEVEIVG